MRVIDLCVGTGSFGENNLVFANDIEKNLKKYNFNHKLTTYLII